MRVLLVGCGNIGFRHLQSLLLLPDLKHLTLIELSQARVEVCREEIDRVRPRLNFEVFDRLTHPGLINKTFDAAVSAVTADIQEALFTQFADFEINLLLLEKPLARSSRKLEELVNFYDSQKKIRRVYVNCSQNSWTGHHEMKSRFSRHSPNAIFHMTVSGYQWGYGCNALHYLELFRFLFSGSKISCLVSHLGLDPRPHKRGAQFEEYSGICLFADEKGNSLQLSSVASALPYSRDPSMEIYESSGNRHWSVDDGEDSIFEMPSGDVWKLGRTFVSQSTGPWIQDMLAQGARHESFLPSLNDIQISHRPLFESLEMSFGKRDFKFT